MSDERLPPRINWEAIRRSQPQPPAPPPPQPKKEQPIQAQPVNARFPMKIGVTVFGTPTYFNVDEAVSEFQNFVQVNSKLDLQITLNKYPPLALDEFHIISGTDGCSFVDPWYVHPETLTKLPPNVAVQIAICDIQNTKTCYGGATYQASAKTRFVPYIGVAFGDSIKWWGVEPNWKTRTATALVHEFYHALSQILVKKGFTNLPDIDKATQYGFNNENDPGWIKFDKHIYGLLTDQMYKVLTQ
jgi:hypothetical protein